MHVVCFQYVLSVTLVQIVTSYVTAKDTYHAIEKLESVQVDARSNGLERVAIQVGKK